MTSTTIHIFKAWPFGRALNVFSLIALLVGACHSCSDSNKDAMPPGTLVKIGDAYLTNEDVVRQMPGGLSAEDSSKLAKAFINSWINSKLASQIAVREIDMTEIDKMVQQYRNELIMHEYNKRMFDAHNDTLVPEDTIRSYYDRNKSEFILIRPMVKGVYLKVAEDAKSLKNLRKIYRSQKENDIDKLDKSELTGTVHYDYFRDKWIDWEQIESRIPMDFGSSADTFLKQHNNIDFTQGGFTYLLDISDVLHTGQIMPYEAARQLIIDKIMFYNRKNYEKNLRESLFDKAKEKGQIQIFCEL